MLGNWSAHRMQTRHSKQVPFSCIEIESIKICIGAINRTEGFCIICFWWHCRTKRDIWLQTVWLKFSYVAQLWDSNQNIKGETRAGAGGRRLFKVFFSFSALKNSCWKVYPQKNNNNINIEFIPTSFRLPNHLQFPKRKSAKLPVSYDTRIPGKIHLRLQLRLAKLPFPHPNRF